MKIRVVELEASAEELRQSNTLSEQLHNLLRGAFQPKTLEELEDDEEEGEDE